MSIRKIKQLFSNKQVSLSADDVRNARKYIDEYWKKLTRYHPKDDDSLLGLPNKYLVPAYEEGHDFDFNELYYWDSYFMVQGMLDAKHKKLVLGILDNLVNLQKRFGAIPNASRTYLTGRSQPPLLTSFIFDVYDAYDMNNKWLADKITVAKDEYNKVWMGTNKPHARQVYMGLSRYYDINHLHDLAEAESGWDMTTRFNRKALDYLPIDLNCMLFKYEMDFHRAYKILGDDEEAKHWLKHAKARKRVMNSLMWSQSRNAYFDYNYVKQKRGSVLSLATLFPLWAGLVDKKHADKLAQATKKFLHKGGLATTDSLNIERLIPGKMPTQWAYPNGWAPLHFIAYQGLKQYGHDELARMVAMRWLKTNLDWFNKKGVFLEKYNVVQPEKPPMKGVYPSQTGFGWTNAVFERFCQEEIDGK